mgnify:CR=1 FL=1
MSTMLTIKKWSEMRQEKMEVFVGGELEVVMLSDSTVIIVNHDAQGSQTPVNVGATMLLNKEPLPFNPTEILGNAIHCLQIHD